MEQFDTSSPVTPARADEFRKELGAPLVKPKLKSIAEAMSLMRTADLAD